MSTKLWGGRFSKDTDASIIGWTESVTIDANLVVEDIWGSLAHVTMLGVQNIVPEDQARAILGKLLIFMTDYQAGKWQLGLQQEDAQMNVEARLIEALGIEIGGKMHTARSRNDQVPLDAKLYTRKRLLELRQKLINACEAILDRAKNYTQDVMVSYTHVQHAQPVSIAYWLSHYTAVFLRDLDRLQSAYDLTDQSPLGAGAIAGSSFPIDRDLTRQLLGFQKIHEHGLDATSSRDYMLETLSTNAILMTTLSRLAEEMILWSSYEFRTLTLDDGFAMGSSMMPQKKNPGTLELLRGRSGRINGLLVAGLTMMKGLPSGYNRDFHEEKEVLVESLDLINRAVEIIPALIKSTQINQERMAKLAEGNFSTATELANYLVREKGVPFRKAHHVVGSLVGKLSRAGQTFSSLEVCAQHLKECELEMSQSELMRVLDPKQVMLSYKATGSTAPEPVSKMLTDFKIRLNQHQEKLNQDQKRVDRAFETCKKIATASADLNLRECVREYLA